MATSPFGSPTGSFATMAQSQPQQGGFGGQQNTGGAPGGFAPPPQQGGFGGQQGGFGMQQGGFGGGFQSPYGPQMGGFGGGFGGFGGGFQSPYGPQMGGFGGGMMGGGFNPYQQQQGYGGGFGGFGGFGGGMGGGFNPYQMQSPYGPQGGMGGYGGGFGGFGGGYGGGFGGGMGGYGRGMGRGFDREVGNQGMMSDMQYRGGMDMQQDMPDQSRMNQAQQALQNEFMRSRGGNLRDNPQESRGNMPDLMQTADMPQYSKEDQMMQRGQMGQLGGSPMYQDYNQAMTMDMPQQRNYGRNSQQVGGLLGMLGSMGSYNPNSSQFRASQAQQAALQGSNYNPMMD